MSEASFFRMNIKKGIDNGDRDVSHWVVMRCEEVVAPCLSPLHSWCFLLRIWFVMKKPPFYFKMIFQTFAPQSNASTDHESRAKQTSVTQGIAVQLGQFGSHYKSDTNYPNDTLKNVQNQLQYRLNSSIKGWIFSPGVWRPFKCSQKYIGSWCYDVSAVPPLSCS